MADAFQRLHRDIQHVLWDMKWEKLHTFQAESIHAWFDQTEDIILMANTASGKTEAAFLPILSSLAENQASDSIQILYIGPLKALINDQFRRVEDLCARAEIPVHRWHGDVSGAKKKSLLKSPEGILLITPESLESLLIRRGRDLPRVFKGLFAVVIDEMHVFLDSERGRQLRSQLSRIDNLRKEMTPARLVGLSATIGDIKAAQGWLQGRHEFVPTVIESQTSRPVELLLKSFVEKPSVMDSSASKKNTENTETGHGLLSVAEYMIETLYGKTNLVFCNRKTDIEILADMLNRICKRRRLENQFMVHHGSLSKALREETEAVLQSGRSCTAICSSTLELGIDVGDVDAVGQVGPPHGVSAMKQRLGRSGRKENTTSRLFLYVPLIQCDHRSSLPDTLYPDLIQAIALVELMVGKRDEEGNGWHEPKWVEPPDELEFDFSTLIQQILSSVAQVGSADAGLLYESLCVGDIFGIISADDFRTLLRDLGKYDLLEQIGSGELILGLKGERIVSHYDFYAAFTSPDQYSVSTKSGQVGTVQAEEGFYQPGQFMLLAGRRWKIIVVDEERKAIAVEPAKGMQVTRWSGSGGAIHHRIREKMQDVVLEETTPKWMESTSRDVLEWSRTEACHHDLASVRIVEDQGGLHIFTWTGTRANHTLYLLFLAAGLSTESVQDAGICITLTAPDITKNDVLFLLAQYCHAPTLSKDLVKYAYRHSIPPVGKYGWILSYDLMAKAYAATNLDQDEAINVAREILRQENFSEANTKGRITIPNISPLQQASPSNPIEWIDSVGALEAFCNSVLMDEAIGLDVETYGKQQELGLIQIATLGKNTLIDPLAIPNLSSLKVVLERERPLKIIHNAESEKSVLGARKIHLNGVLDTLELSRRALIMRNHDLGTVCENVMGLVLDKACQQSDWRRRPLTTSQIQYAALDAEVLLPLYHKLSAGEL